MSRQLPPFVLQVVGIGLLVVGAILALRGKSGYQIMVLGTILAGTGNIGQSIQKAKRKQRRYEIPPEDDELTRYRQERRRHRERMQRLERERELEDGEWDDER